MYELVIVMEKSDQIDLCDDALCYLLSISRSLVETNDHLLQELHETKHKHQKEVEQMHWSYDQMKNTMAFSASRSHSHLNGSGNNSNQTLSNQFSDSLNFKDS